MKFTILSHAGLMVEHQGITLVTDPWLIGSCYWRSWWNFPEPAPELLARVSADYVYLTHLHWDHYHGPSLQKFFAPETTFLLPKVCTTRMMDDLRGLGFSRFIEIPHGKTHQIGPDFSLCSYQFGLAVDSAAVIKGGGVTILNANDCKLFGQPLRHLLRRHGRPDFALRSHSSASPVPYCVEDYKKHFPKLRTQEDYIEEFARFAISVGARYAVPFASNHCFLHRETEHFNDTAVSPDLVERYCNQLAREVKAPTECVVMNPGSSWSKEGGFDFVEFDFARRPEVIDEMRRKYKGKLEQFYAEESHELADFDAFRSYFEKFLAAVPEFIRRRWKPALMFRIVDAERTHRWLVEPCTRTIRAVEADMDGLAVIEVPPRVINDCTTTRMFSAWTPSKRLKIILPKPQALGAVKLFFTLVDAYELDHLPLRRNLSPRSLSVYLRRWREAAEAAGLVIKHKLFKRPFDIPALYPLTGVQPGKKLSRPEVPRPVPRAQANPVTGAEQAQSVVPAAAVENLHWISVVRAEDLPDDGSLAVESNGLRLVLFSLNGGVYALEDRCSHRGAPLSAGQLDGCEVVCPLHGARFDVRDGSAKCRPAKEPVATYAVRVVDGMVMVALPVSDISVSHDKLLTAEVDETTDR